MYSNSTALDGSEEIPDGWECTAAVQRETAKAVFGVSLDRDLEVDVEILESIQGGKKRDSHEDKESKENC